MMDRWNDISISRLPSMTRLNGLQECRRLKGLIDYNQGRIGLDHSVALNGSVKKCILINLSN